LRDPVNPSSSPISTASRTHPAPSRAFPPVLSVAERPGPSSMGTGSGLVPGAPRGFPRIPPQEQLTTVVKGGQGARVAIGPTSPALTDADRAGAVDALALARAAEGVAIGVDVALRAHATGGLGHVEVIRVSGPAGSLRRMGDGRWLIAACGDGGCGRAV